jgi:hypothetical protein
MGYPFQAHSNRTYTLTAANSQTIDVPLNGSARWRVNLALAGIGAIDALQFAISATNGVDFGPLQTPTAPPLPIAAGTSGQLTGNEAGVILRLDLTSNLGCDVTISVGGF